MLFLVVDANIDMYLHLLLTVAVPLFPFQRIPQASVLRLLALKSLMASQVIQ